MHKWKGYLSIPLLILLSIGYFLLLISINLAIFNSINLMICLVLTMLLTIGTFIRIVNVIRKHSDRIVDRMIQNQQKEILAYVSQCEDREFLHQLQARLDTKLKDEIHHNQ